jgi:DNA-binding MarR family transcriptional regulator
MTDPELLELKVADCLLLNTIKTARTLARRYDARIRPFGVTVVQFSILFAIRRNRDKSIAALAEEIAMERTTLTRNVDLLVRKGHVVKVGTGKGNAKTCRLTDTGTALLDRLIGEWATVRLELRDTLKGQDPDRYMAFLRTLGQG